MEIINKTSRKLLSSKKRAGFFYSFSYADFLVNEIVFQTIIGTLGIIYLVLQCVFSTIMNRYFTGNLNLQLDNMDLTKEFMYQVKASMIGQDTAMNCYCR